MKHLLLILALVFMLVPFQVSAQDSVINQASETANTWADFDMTMSYSGNGFSKKRRAIIDEGEVVYTTSTTVNGLMFSCLSGHFTVAASVEPQDFRVNFSKTSRRNKRRYVDMRLDDDEKSSLGVWIYKPSLHGLASTKRYQAAKLYNAVVRRQKVTLYFVGKKPIVLDLPKPNSEFADFGAGCGIGKLAKKK